jgi:hypothetical protein
MGRFRGQARLSRLQRDRPGRVIVAVPSQRKDFALAHPGAVSERHHVTQHLRGQLGQQRIELSPFDEPLLGVRMALHEVAHLRNEGDEAVLLAKRQRPMENLRLPVDRRVGGTGDGFGSQRGPIPQTRDFSLTISVW